MDAEEWVFEPETLSGEELVRFGQLLDKRPAELHGRNVVMELAEHLLYVRTRTGLTRSLCANEVQQAFEERRGRRNIILKARQMGLTTWAAARFFLKTITQPRNADAGGGTHPGVRRRDLPHRASFSRLPAGAFAQWMPQNLARQCAADRISGVRFSVSCRLRGRAQCRPRHDGAESALLGTGALARRSGGDLAGLRAALAPDGEEILESTPDGIGGCFYKEWQNGAGDGDGASFLSVVDGAAISRQGSRRELADRGRAGADRTSSTEPRADRISTQNAGQFRGLARQEYAEDAGKLLSSQRRLCLRTGPRSSSDWQRRRRPSSSRHNGELEIWLPPVAGKQYLVAVDPAGGGSEGDYSALEVLEMETGLQCAEFAGHVGGLELAQLVTSASRSSTTARGWWWSATITAAACWR